MYLEIDEGYFDHPKTLALCAALGDHNAIIYPLRLWKWACRSARSGLLSNMEPFAIEKVVEYHPMDGKCYYALVKAGFIDSEEHGAIGIHDWMNHTGGAIKRMESKAEENKRRRAEGKAKHASGEAESRRNRASIEPVEIPPRPDQTRPDKTRQDQTSLKGEAPPIPARRFRPTTPHDLILCLKIAVESCQPRNGMWASGPFATRDAEHLLQSLGDVEKAAPEVEAKIACFASDPAMTPWTVKRFAQEYNGIGRPKRADGRRDGAPPVTYPKLRE